MGMVNAVVVVAGRQAQFGWFMVALGTALIIAGLVLLLRKVAQPQPQVAAPGVAPAVAIPIGAGLLWLFTKGGKGGGLIGVGLLLIFFGMVLLGIDIGSLDFSARSDLVTDPAATTTTTVVTTTSTTIG